MKKSNFKLIALGSIALLTATYSCKNALDTNPTGVLGSAVLANKAGVDGLLIGAYSLLDGYYSGQPGTNYGSGISNWSFGGLASDDAYKGSDTGDQGGNAAGDIEAHIVSSSNDYVYSKWQVNLAGVVRANNVIAEVPLVKDGSLTAAQGAQAIGEARFLRGVYNFELMKVFRNVPYVDETVNYAAGNLNVPNAPIWDKIEADFTAAMAALPTTQSQPGRANKWAAQAFLAKAYMYDHKYTQALPLLTDLITNGTTASGAKYALGAYGDNFYALTRNNAESVFAAQMTTKDGSNGQNSDFGDVLNFPGGGTYTSCCGFYIPSYNLANAFKTDAAGLPMFQKDATTGFPMYNVTNLKNDHGLAAGAAFTPTTEAVDPRLDFTVGRRGIPYQDWGLCGGETWTRGDLAPYTPKKNVFFQKDVATTADQGGGWATSQGSAINYLLIRVADLYLWRAECYVEANNLAAAEADVNVIRNRMAQHPEYWVHTYVDNSAPSKGNTTTPAANYVIKPYTGQFAANGQAYARQAVYMEHQLEFGMEGHRFFDLQRWDAIFGGPAGANYMANTINAYIKADTRISNPVLNGRTFVAGKHEVFPIPQIEISREGGALKQNPGY
ncbi:RagB/SusD family nutrient uptake outer membrane protein [Mucilaginibacter ginkgonis]|uniref:RagB/SusD family nutrient uptake outer membrane protein n=1 Tax=Mucilaginibacter ginkgonis TaxID=2682091 RepID=A0A6I4INI3_9SPHI|nr:RagB/SusD family nutrient uptake outer membrane protein [Mucilaginibacter ginkgonis]QQL48652.1 RagB/SusD family nutrient uptake outer membrane protein [Mucilaginibacter ginkgonis]